MSSAALLASTSETELEILSQTTAQDNPTWRKKRIFSLSSALHSSRRALKDAWNDLSSGNRYRQRFKTVEWCRVGRIFLLFIWNLFLLILPIYLILLSLLGLDDDSPCQWDRQFHLKSQLGRFNPWATSGFFEVTLGWGRLTFANAKLIDVAWDLVVGRGGQAIMALISWRVFAKYLQVSIATRPATYTTVWLLRFQQDSSAFSTLRLISQFFKRGLASKTVMVFIAMAALFILAFPTFASSMTGYSPYNEAYVTGHDGRLIRFSEVSPVAYMIHDGDRVGFGKDYYVPWKGGSKPSAEFLYDDLLDKCHTWQNVSKECELQRNVSEYVQGYGIEASGGNKTANNQNQTEFGGEMIDWPPLNISAFYLPDGSFYWDGTNRTESRSYVEDYEMMSKITYLVDGALYNSTELGEKGVCQPIKGEDSIQRYQWGFSFLQLVIMTVLLQLWTIGLIALRSYAHRSLELNHYTTASQGWKGLIEFTDAIKLQLQTANINPHDLQDKQLEHKIQEILGGGAISSQSFSQESLSAWQWIHKRKGWVFTMLITVLIVLDHSLRIQSGYFFIEEFQHPAMLLIQTITFSVFYAIFCAIVAFFVGITIAQRIIVFLFAAGLCAPFFFLDVVERDLFLPGVCLGTGLALFLGSTRGSRIVLFTVPTCCNYIAILALFLLYRN